MLASGEASQKERLPAANEKKKDRKAKAKQSEKAATAPKRKGPG